ncbi:MAG: hypothetical protein KAI24_13325 [Planctomycetes bacterium]|nr:hypothetical protein [Planctomycetota bacterium]
MKLAAAVLGCGVVDLHGISGTRGVSVTWRELDTTPPGTGKTLKAVFGRSDATFRRIDLPARALVLACEACDLERVLTEQQRNDAAICVETDTGSLTTDVDFERSLQDEVVHAGIFPYSLTSTSLGEVALRYKLRGPTVSMSVLASTPGESLREAMRMLAAGDAPFVVAGTLDAVREPAGGHAATLRAVVAVLGPPQTGSGLGSIGWPDEADPDPFAPFVRMCR